jgi:hypothetical protein
MIQPHCQRINSAVSGKDKHENARLPKGNSNIKARSNSSNALNKTEGCLESGEDSNGVSKHHNYHSAHRTKQNSKHRTSDSQSEVGSMIKAVKLAITDKRCSFANGYVRSNTQGIHLLPSTNKVYRNTKRIEFSRRMHMMDRPIVIIKFEGIVGHFHKERIW